LNLDADMIQGGAVVVLCMIVLFELRQLRPVMTGVRDVLAALLERDRIRSERRREPSTPPPSMPDDFAPESTDLHDIMEKQRQRRSRAQTPRGGVRSPRPGTHHDTED
jgi:hypothetical protein